MYLTYFYFMLHCTSIPLQNIIPLTLEHLFYTLIYLRLRFDIQNFGSVHKKVDETTQQFYHSTDLYPTVIYLSVATSLL